MSDTIIPYSQKPIPCDFGPFAGGVCYRKLDVRLDVATSEILLQDITLTTNEDVQLSIDLSTYVNSLAKIDWTKTQITNLNSGTFTFSGSTIIYTPDQTATTNRTISFNYSVVDVLAFEASALITINIIDKTPSLSAQNVTLSGTEAQVYTIDIKTKVQINNTNVDWTNVNSLVISQAPTEGTATVSNGVITFTPTLTPSTNRTIPMKYKVTTIGGLMSEATISVTVSDITPALTAKDFSITVLDTATKTVAMLGNLTIKNDTFKNMVFDLPSEGTITVTGSSLVFAPDEAISGNRVITVNYTATTNSGLTDTGVMTINITDDNIWAGSIWYGNSTLDVMTKEGVMALSNTLRQQDFPGTYNYTAGTGVYKWIVYPSAWGAPLRIIDPVTGFEVATDDIVYLTVETVELICIRSFYQLNGSYQIQLI